MQKARKEAVFDADSTANAPTDSRVKNLALTVTFPGSNQNIKPVSADPLQAKFNYFVGDNAAPHHSNVPSYGAIVYKDLYKSIDLHVTGDQTVSSILKYEFHCAPGADAHQIQIHYDGIDSLRVDDQGDLLIQTSFGTLRDRAPLVWQKINGQRHQIEAHFKTIDGQTYTIEVTGSIDPSEELVLDPQVDWAVYLGGSSFEFAFAVIVDHAGNLIETGSTQSSDFEGHNNTGNGDVGFWGDGFVVKTDSVGNLLWMTYVGGDSHDYPSSIVASSNDQLIMVGSTNSRDLANHLNALHGDFDAFVAKIDQSGNLLWTEYLGGSDEERSAGVVLNSSGDIFISGGTLSNNFEGHLNENHSAHADAFIVRLDSAGTLQWMKYIGGSAGDLAEGMVLGPDGNLIITGQTASADFDEHLNNYNGGATDAFVSSIDSSGQVLWSTFIGGSHFDCGYGLTFDSLGNIDVVGQTESMDLNGTSNTYYGGDFDAFVAQIQSDGQMAWSEYLGGSGSDSGNSIVSLQNGFLAVAGSTKSPDFAGRINRLHSPYGDAFVSELDMSGGVRTSFYVGGNFEDTQSGMVTDGLDKVVIAGTTGSTNLDHAINTLHGGRYTDAFLAEVDLSTSINLSVDSSCPNTGPLQINWSGASPDSRVVIIFSPGLGGYSSVPINLQCAGTVLGLGVRGIRLVESTQSDQSGSGTINANASPNVCGGYLQLLDLSDCQTSNLARVH